MPREPVAPAPTASHLCVKGENATALMLARLAMAGLVAFVQPVAPLGSVVDPMDATPARPTPPATHHGNPSPYIKVYVVPLTVRTPFVVVAP